MPIDPSKVQWDGTPVIDVSKVEWDSPKQSKDYQAGKQAPGALQGLLSVIQGPTMGFGDELAGAVGGLYDTAVKGGSLSDNYVANRDYARGAQANQSEVNPWVTGLSQVAASAPLGALKLFGAAPASGAVSRPMNMLQRILQSGGIGAGYGAVSGAGNSTADSVGGVALDAAKGAATGAALSGAAVPVGSVLVAVGGNVAQRISQSSATNYAKEKIAEALARDGRGQVVKTTLSNPVQQAAARLDKLGNEAVIADAGGQSTRALLDTLATLPGRTKDAASQLLRERKTSSANRLISAADDALGTNGQRLQGTIEELIQQRSDDASPLYQRVRALSVEPSKNLTNILKIADDIGAMKEARRSAKASGAPFTYDLKNKLPDGVTNAPVINGVSMGDMDHVKRGLDQMIAAEKNDLTGKLSPIGAKYQALKQRLVEELDAVTTDPNTGQSVYKQARNAFEGPSALMDAARAGNAAMSQNEAKVSQSVANMTPSELDAFRVGAYEALREKIGRSAGGRTELMNMAENPAISEKLKVIFGGTRPFREFAANVEKERILKQLQSTGAGSQTAARQYAAGDLDVSALQDAGSAVASAAGGNMTGALKGALNAWNRVKTPETVRDQMGQILLSGGAQGKNNLAEMMMLAGQINAKKAQQSNALGALLSRPAGTWFLD